MLKGHEWCFWLPGPVPSLPIPPLIIPNNPPSPPSRVLLFGALGVELPLFPVDASDDAPPVPSPSPLTELPSGDRPAVTSRHVPVGKEGER